MNGNKLFLDTNIILYLLNGDKTLAELLHGRQIYISVITELELLSYTEITAEEETVVKEFIDGCKTIDLNDDIKHTAIYLRKKYKNKLPDSIIMATACYLDLPLVTSDMGFKKVLELKLLIYDHQ